MPKHGDNFSKDHADAIQQAAASASSPEEAMELVRKKEAEMLANNPFVPPKGCPINDLPNELLSHIFWLGFLDDGDESDEEEDWEDSDEDEDMDRPVNYDIVPQNVGAIEVEQVETGFSLESALRRAVEVRGRIYQYTVGVTQEASGGNDSDGTCEDCDHSTLSSVDSGDDQDDEDDRYTLPFQVLVSHVCRHWRNVAIDSPALWTQIDFREGAPYERTQIMLERSKNLPLTIDINCDMTTSAPRDDDQEILPNEIDLSGERLIHSLRDVGVMLDVICPHIDRWQSLEFMVRNYEYMHRFLQRLSQLSGAPQLEVLQLYHYEDNDDNSHFEPANLIEHFEIFQGNAPKLRTVSLWGVHIKWTVLCTKDNCTHESCPRSILGNVKDLELAYHPLDVRPSYDALASYLRSSTELHTLALCQSGPAGEYSSWPSVRESLIELPSVRELAIMYQECDYACALLDRLALPNLESLAIDFDEEDYSSLARHLSGPAAGDNQGRSLLSRLQRLKIAGLNTDEAGIDLIYGQLDQLKTLNLNLDAIEFAWFTKLIESRPYASSSTSASSVSAIPSSDIYLPNLETFTVTGLNGSDLRGFVEMRKEQGLALKKVFVSDDTKVNKHDLKYLQENVEFEYFEPSDSEEYVDISDEEVDSDEGSL